MNKATKSLLNISATLAIICAILSFVVPLFLGGFLIIGLGILFGIIAFFGEKRTLGIVAVILSIVALLASPTFWLYLASLGQTRNPKSNSQVLSKEDTNGSISSNTSQDKLSSEEQFLNQIQKEAKENPNQRKSFSFALEKLEDGTYKYYPAIYQNSNQESVEEIFRQKGLSYSTGIVSIEKINKRSILEINAIQQSKNPQQMKEFFDLFKGKELEEVIGRNWQSDYIYPLTKELYENYKSEIQELQEYSGFSGVVLQ